MDILVLVDILDFQVYPVIVVFQVSLVTQESLVFLVYPDIQDFQANLDFLAYLVSQDSLVNPVFPALVVILARVVTQAL